MKYTIDAQVLGQVVTLEGEIGHPREVRDIIRELLGFDKEAPEPALSAFGMQIVRNPAVTATAEKSAVVTFEIEPGSEGVVYPSVDDVSEAVKVIVAKKGVPRAAELLKAHGGARSDLVPAENRAAFIAAAAAELAAT